MSLPPAYGGGSGIPESEKGAPNGVAELDGNGDVPLDQIPDSVKADGKFRGTYPDPAALAGIPSPTDGDTAFVTSTATSWAYLAGSWGDTGAGSIGDMLRAVYDPQSINDDAFDRANHTGQQLASTISDFNAEVSNNPDVTANSGKVSADGSVTTHNDVTSAGSGEIITAAERSLLASALQSVSSDDTLSGDGAGVPLSVNQLFALRSSDDQSIWRAGQTTEGLINTQANVFEDYFGAPLVFTAARSKRHAISTSLTWSLDSTTQNFIAQLQIQGDQGFNVVLTLPSEPQDSGGGAGLSLNTIAGGAIGANSNTSTDQIFVLDVTRWFELVAGETYTVTLRFTASGAGLDAAIYNAQLACKEEING